MSVVFQKLAAARKAGYSRAVLAQYAGVSIAIIDRCLKKGEVDNEKLSKALSGMTNAALDKIKAKVTDNRGRRPAGEKKSAAPKKKARAKKTSADVQAAA